MALPKHLTSGAPPHVTMSVAEGELCGPCLRPGGHIAVSNRWWAGLQLSVYMADAGVAAKYAGELVGVWRSGATAGSTLFNVEGVKKCN